MKNKLIAALVSVSLVLLSAITIVSAQSSVELGDINGDEKITAMDARIALRASSKLENLSEEQFVAADVNFDNKVTAMDARTILRVASKLDVFPEKPTEDSSDDFVDVIETTTLVLPEPDTDVVVEEYPEVIDAFLSGSFYLDAVLDPGSSMSTKMATNKTGMEIVMESGSSQLSFMVYRGKSYLKVITSDGKKYYAELTKELMDKLGFDFSEILSELSFGTAEDLGLPVLTQGEINGADCDIYTFKKEDKSLIKFYAVDGKIVNITASDAQEKDITSISVNELNAEIPDTMLSLKNFKETSLIFLATLVPDLMG